MEVKTREPNHQLLESFKLRSVLSLLLLLPNLFVVPNELVAADSAGESNGLNSNQALRLLADSVSRIKSFEIFADVETTRFYRTESRKQSEANKSRTVFIDLPESEVQATVTAYRQLFLHTGKTTQPMRLFERFKEGGASTLSVLAFDGEVRRSLYADETSGIVGTLPSENYRISDQGHDYLDLIGHLYRGTPLLQRLSQSDIEVESVGDRLLIHGRPTFEKLPGKGYRVWLSYGKGMMIERMEFYQVIPEFVGDVHVGGNGEELVIERMVVDESISIDDSLVVPVRITRSLYHPRGDRAGKIDDKIVMRVDTDRSSWNAPLGKTDFAFDFPAGTKVYNELLGVDLVVGDSAAGKHIDDLLDTAAQVIPAEERSLGLSKNWLSKNGAWLSAERRTLRILVICANAIVFGGILYCLAVSRRKQREQTKER